LRFSLKVIITLKIAESAQILIRNVNYEVPSLKKQVLKCQQIMEDCEKSAEDCVKQSNNYKNEYFAAAENLGISVRIL